MKLDIFRAALIGLCAAALLPSTAAARELQGDPRAIAAVERMFEQLGGRDAWARTRSIYLEYRVWRTDPDERLTERAWRDLAAPNQRIDLDSPSAPLAWVFTADGGWVRRAGETRALSDAGRQSALGFWPFDFYTMLRRLAAADPELVLEFREPRRVIVRSREGADWGWWEIDSTGALLKWGAISDGEALEYVYGPSRRFGDIAFPAWGAAVDGSWRFEYAAIITSEAAIPSAQLQQPG